VAVFVFGGLPLLGGVIGFALFAAACAWMRRGGVDRLWKAGVALYCTTALVRGVMSLPAALGEPDVATQALYAERVATMQASVEHARAGSRPPAATPTTSRCAGCRWANSSRARPRCWCSWSACS
jgi:hypothetical protein